MFGNILAGVADLLSTAEADYAISVHSIIYEHSNQKKNKFSDYVLFKINNSYVQSVVELSCLRFGKKVLFNVMIAEYLKGGLVVSPIILHAVI